MTVNGAEPHNHSDRVAMTDKTYTQEDLDAMVKAQVAEQVSLATEGLKKKNDELLSEKKTATSKVAEIEEAQKSAEEAGMKQREEYKELHERGQDTIRGLTEKLHAKEEKERKDALSLSTLAMAGELSRNTAKAGLLAEQAAKYATYADGVVTYEIGGISVDADKVKEHLTEKLGFLVDGSGNTGGGAVGASGGGGAAKKFSEYSGAELSALQSTDPEKYAKVRESAKHLHRQF